MKDRKAGRRGKKNKRIFDDGSPENNEFDPLNDPMKND